jgi:hypothetical protein
VKRFACIRTAPALLIAVVLFATHTARAGGPWNQKPYGDWNRRDVRKILFHSPWVRHFTLTRRALESELPDPGPSGMELRGYHAKEARENGAETTEFYVRWVSSRTLRQASARKLALLKHAPNQAEISPKVLDEFEISIAGPVMSAFDNAREATLRSKCYLRVSSNRKIAASRVEFARWDNGKVRGVLFRFPRKRSDGEPLISTHDRKVWFIEYSRGVEIRVSFNLQSMVDSNGLDL